MYPECCRPADVAAHYWRIQGFQGRPILHFPQIVLQPAQNTDAELDSIQ